MWFRNLQLYRLPSGWKITAADLESRLAARPLSPCGSQDMESRGWVAPGGDDACLRTVGGHWLIALGVEARLLPSSVVRQEADARAESMAEKQGFRPGRKQLRELREQITQELLPRAFTRRRRVFAWIDPVGGWMGIDAPSPTRAEEVLEQLRDTLDDFPLALPRTERSPAAAMAAWLAEAPPANFTIDEDCELRSISEERATVRYAHHPLDGGEIKDHLAAGKLPTKLALTFNDRLSFVLTDKLELKRLDFLDVVREELGNEDDAEALFDAEFALMTGELLKLIPALIEALGGEMAAA
ncbi:MAG: recombination-associated protein RdgC [Azoarcus sp.]|jgi:recombination associated protein RdgC|nr:recombination-associated protein RdgC [Azoarcus sp.]